MVLVLNQPQFSIHLFSLTLPLQFYQVIHPNTLNLQSLGHWSAFWRQGTMRRWYQIMWLLFPTRDEFQIICVLLANLSHRLVYHSITLHISLHTIALSIPLFFPYPLPFSSPYSQIPTSLLLYLIFLPFSLNFAPSPSLPISHNLFLFQNW